MAPRDELRRAEEAIRRAAEESDAIVTLDDREGRAARERLTTQMRSIDERLRRTLDEQLKQFGSGEAELSGAAILVILALARVSVARATDHLSGHLRRGTTYATKAASKQTSDLLATLEEVFEGKVTSSQLKRLYALMDETGYKKSLLATQQASVNRYGVAMINEFQQILQQGIINGQTQRQIVAALTEKGGGIFTNKKWWAERIVRTEVARAHNAAKEVAYQQYEVVGITVKKKILAIFDNRTAYDSVYVHGQVRGPGEYFLDGAGRLYLFPPARPNDRETIIPWKEYWRELRMTEEIPASEMPAPPRGGLRKTPEVTSPIKGLQGTP